jgi:hypothetical protein
LQIPQQRLSAATIAIRLRIGIDEEEKVRRPKQGRQRQCSDDSVFTLW